MANKFNKFYAQSLKLKAASADPYFKKKVILEDKINKINEEYEMKKQQALQKLEEELKLVQAGIDAIDNIVKAETDGYSIEDLCVKEGKKWVLRYPETIVPVNCGAECPECAEPVDSEDSTQAIPEAEPQINPFN